MKYCLLYLLMITSYIAHATQPTVKLTIDSTYKSKYNPTRYNITCTFANTGEDTLHLASDQFKMAVSVEFTQKVLITHKNVIEIQKLDTNIDMLMDTRLIQREPAIWHTDSAHLYFREDSVVFAQNKHLTTVIVGNTPYYPIAPGGSLSVYWAVDFAIYEDPMIMKNIAPGQLEKLEMLLHLILAYYADNRQAGYFKVVSEPSPSLKHTIYKRYH